MLREMLMGAAAGAVGTVALNTATYADMVVRARPASSVPSTMTAQLADKVGIDLSGEGEDAGETAQNRQSGFGALFGIATGVGVGTTYGLVRPALGYDVSKTKAGIVLGLAAMAGSDIPSAALGVTNPAQWGINSWVSDLVPHLAYGFVTAAAYELFDGR